MDSRPVTETDPSSDSEGRAELPGLLVVFSAGAPTFRALPLPPGRDVEIGRGKLGIEDGRVSRAHARVRFDAGRLFVRDLGSTNGTYIDGVPLTGDERGYVVPRSLRTGGTLFLPMRDVRPFVGVPTRRDKIVVGATLAVVHAGIRRAAEFGESLLLRGASGTGKELAARVFHEAGPFPKGPLVVVNCAAIPEGVAERLLFGAKRGAYSGADADAEGYLQAADGGTLFLDELAELDLLVQAKLLRFLESREVLPLGATKPKRVDVRVVSATHADLRQRVTDGRFREDLYYRIGKPEIRLPALRERTEEIAAHVAAAVSDVGEGALSPDVTLVEACALRDWPGNVRELMAEVRRATFAAASDHRDRVLGSDLDPNAGNALLPESVMPPPLDGPPEDEYAAALREEGGNVSRAALRLGVHRNRVRRWLEKHSTKGSNFR